MQGSAMTAEGFARASKSVAQTKTSSKVCEATLE